MTKHSGDPHSPKGRNAPHDHQPAIIDPPNHLAMAPSEIHHPVLQRHAALKANALMANVMAQARGPASEIGPRLVLLPNVINAMIVGTTDEQGVGIDLVNAGVVVQVEAWTPMVVGDLLELFWGTYPGAASVSKQLTTPDELYKPVQLPIPAAIISAGWVSIVARVTRFGSGFLDVSPALSLLVKLDPPGNIYPPPEPSNPNLAAPVLPPDVIANGVDAAWSANGVPVTIQPYPNMLAGDRIRLNWGSAYIERTVVQADVDNPVTLTVDDATIRSAGDSDALTVRYQVFDLVNNRSGWSPSVAIEVNVIEGALLPPEVNHTDTNNVIDLDLLGSDDVSVFVTAFGSDFAIGDTVYLSWIGHTATGAQVPYYDNQQVTRSPVQTLEFLIPNASVVALAQGDAVVSYSLQNGKTSRSTTVTIVGQAAALPKPSIVEAPSGQLDASLSSATVVIPANPIFAPGDTITLTWSGTRADGTALLYQDPRNFTGAMLNKDVLIPVLGSQIAPLAGGTLQVWYTVVHGDGTALPQSDVLTLRVSGSAGLLLPPKVVEAPDNATLDPDDVGLQANVLIPPYTNPVMEVNDRIDLYWVGSSGDTWHDWTFVSTTTKDREISLPVEKQPYVNDNIGGTVTVSYTVTKGTDTWNSAPLPLQVGQTHETPITLTVPTVTEADPYTDTLNLIDFNGYLTSAHVECDYDGMAIGDTVTMSWQGTAGSGTQQQQATVATIGPVVFLISNATLTPNYNRSVQISYTVLRAGKPAGSEESSPPLDLAIQYIAMQGTSAVSGGDSHYDITMKKLVISESLNVGDVIATSGSFLPTGSTTVSSSTQQSGFFYNGFGNQPKAESSLFPTKVPGIGFRLLYGNGLQPMAGGPSTFAKTYSNAGMRAALQFVKTGPIAAASPLAMDVFLQWYFGANRQTLTSFLLYMS